MTIKKILLTAATVFGLSVGLSANAAGDIYGITPCDKFGADLPVYTTYADPTGAGSELYFKIRLGARDDSTNCWDVVYTGSMSTNLALYTQPMQIGIFVSGRLQYATLVEWHMPADEDLITSLIFKYTTKPGDFAMPITLATNSGGQPVPATDTSSGSSYYLNPLRNFWNVTLKTTNDTVVACDWRIGARGDFPPIVNSQNTYSPDYSLKNAGFYVKTAGFSDDWEIPGTAWRTIHENSTITGGGIVPKIVMDSAPEEETTLYVWSDNKSAVTIKGGTPVTMKINASGATDTISVGKITFKGGQVSQDFLIEGAVGGEGQTANIILSAYDHFNYSAATSLQETDYISVPVRCIEPMPPTIIVECDRATAVANSHYTTYAAVLNVYLSQPYDTDDVTVTLTPSFTDGHTGAMKDYLRFSAFDTIDEPSADGSDYAVPTVTIPRGSTARQTLYVYCLRSDAHTVGSAKIKFQSSLVDQSTAEAVITSANWLSASINVGAETTKIVTPAEGSQIATTCNDELPFTIAVEDTYADTHDVTTGYEIYVKYRATDTYKKLDGTYYVGEYGALYKLDTTPGATDPKTGSLPILKYTASGMGLASEVYVVAPVNPNSANAKKSEIRHFLADVKEARTVNIDTYDGNPAECDEGAKIRFKITLSEKNETGAPLYAYLKPSENVTADMFAASPYRCVIGMNSPTGLPINNSQDSAQVILSILDGKADPGLQFTLEVMLSTDAHWNGTDMTKKLGGYDSNSLMVTAYNIEPTIERIELDNVESEGDNYTFPNRVPMGQTKHFKAVVSDPGEYDLTNTNEPFKVRWTATRNGVTYPGSVLVIEGDPDAETNKFNYAFPAPGEWKIVAQVKDKDMRDWSKLKYTVYVNVLEQPSAECLGDPEVKLDENDLRKWRYTGTVSYFDDAYTGNLDILVSVGLYNPAKSTNPGTLELDESFRLAPAAAQAKIAAAGIPSLVYNPSNTYYFIQVSQGRSQMEIPVTRLDGTANSADHGFKIQSWVINADVLPTSGEPAKDYYIESPVTRVLVDNVAPVCVCTPQNSETNAWKVASGGSNAYGINWRVRSDVDDDFNHTEDGVQNGIRVEFSGCANGETESKYIHEPTSGTFYPSFGSTPGLQTVILTIYDKDEGSVSYTYFYEVQSAKSLITQAHGPTAGTTTSKLSQKYERLRASKDGIGEGHTWSDQPFAGAKSFRASWNCGKLKAANIYAYGYKVSADPTDPTKDDGSLDGGRDTAIDGNGNASAGTPPTTAYVYDPADGKDSFFYCWILTSMDESGKAADSILGDTIAPETLKKDAVGKIPLPTSEDDEGGYPDTEVEAIFAKEYLASDNLGDINQDGIPDVFALATYADGKDSLIASATEKETLDGDTIDISKFNGDEDKLPGVYSQTGNLSLSGEANLSYAPVGRDFTAFMELRGFHEGLNLNDPNVAKSDPCLSEAETNAYRVAWNKANEAAGLVWDPSMGIDLGFWSPEPIGPSAYPHMDPTTDDTDGDGFPDGWEYFFWYQAKVRCVPDENGEVNDRFGNPLRGPGYHQTYLFERFDVEHIVQGTKIEPEEVIAHFNPLGRINREAEAFSEDFDNDGLTDMEELLLGTNPCHWDSDGDRMCDGWEVLRGLNPINYADRDGNPDNDFMAFCSTSGRRGCYGYIDRDGDGVDETRVLVLDFEGAIKNGVNCNYQDGVMDEAHPFWYLDNLTLDNTLDPQDANGDDNARLYIDNDTALQTTAPLDSAGNPNQDCVNLVSSEVATEDIHLTSALIIIPLANRLYYGAPPGIEMGKYWGYEMVDNPHAYGLEWRREFTITNGSMIVRSPDYCLIHDQVHEAFGFDPRTAWAQTANGYVANRWDPGFNHGLSPLDSTGLAVNTRPYRNYDEYLVMQYRRDYLPMGLAASGAGYTSWPLYDANERWNPKDPFAMMSAYTTMPTINWSTKDIEEKLNSTNLTFTADQESGLVETKNVSEAVAAALKAAGSSKSTTKGHGADTDGDGMPDGWELYMGRNPNAPPNEFSMDDGTDPAYDLDHDGLSVIFEYAGTDSCNWYKDCDSIYKNHPGNRGWYNKFFPTDPDNADTDGDGIADGAEGASWGDLFYYNEAIWPGENIYSFIYGNPEDDGLTACIRGGGMNPCTVDTDLDGIPDPWEMQYAGVIVNSISRSYAGPGQCDVEFVDATWVADGILNASNDVKNVNYITAGMDATWNGDALTIWTSADPLLGTIRDVDFDHDGLENYQEYLIQSMRHFRYDDITTPLMGRQIIEGTYDFQTFSLLTPHAQRYEGCIPMDSGDPSTLALAAFNKWNNPDWGMGSLEIKLETNNFTNVENEYSGQVAVIADTTVTTNIVGGFVGKLQNGDFSHLFAFGWDNKGWRNAGYFATPVHGWDRMLCAQTITPVIMMPPFMAGGYVSTDPRIADTDDDGLDDYYEMFHGLNPILGSQEAGSGKDVIAAMYGCPLVFNAFWNEWTCPRFSRLKAILMNDNDSGRPQGLIGPEGLDPVLYPWSVGVAEADPDGDGLRNLDERICANAASPGYSHTDPTPLWFTDTTKASSYVSQYYLRGATVGSMPWYPMSTDPEYVGAETDWLYAFEENEGYDTDNDWKSDGREVTRTTTVMSDPLKESDPVRRQALYLDGVNSYAMSYVPQYRAMDAADLLIQFTVEAWVCPEKTGVEQTIIDRCSAYGPSADNKDKLALRSNFRIGLTTDGRVYGLFDNSDAIESGLNQPLSCQKVFSLNPLALGEWAHVAVSYDGKALRLYVNGLRVDMAETSLRPANGVKVIFQQPTGEDSFPCSQYEFQPCAFFIGARPGRQATKALYPVDPDMPGSELFGNVRDFYQGYVDEVRVWDGARTGIEIQASYRRAFTFEDVVDNREQVFLAWNGETRATRNDSDGQPMLPAELIQHYDFGTLPGAVNAADVAKIPVGFESAVAQPTYFRYDSGEVDITGLYDLKTVKGGTDYEFAPGIEVGWWKATALRSTVYDDYRVIPWIENTVAHLPYLDGSCLDSTRYNENFGCKYTLPDVCAVKSFVFPNSATPYTIWHYDLQRWDHAQELLRVVETYGEEYQDIWNKYRFEIRSRFTGTSDLIPLGGAFAKTAAQMWDGQGAADAWDSVGADLNENGLPDWWETVAVNSGYVAAGTTAVEPTDWVTYNRNRMPAWQAYLRDLAKGMQPDGTVNPAYADTSDVDGDGIADWWEQLYGVDTGSIADRDADPDGDGLSNYQEYILSEIYPNRYANLTNASGKVIFLNPTLRCTEQGQKVTDYFLAYDSNCGDMVTSADGLEHFRKNEYFGEIVSDHDFMENWWERSYPGEYTSTVKYDPTKDYDGDGWSAWAECRYSQWSAYSSMDRYDYWTGSENDQYIPCYPRPIVGVNVTYFGQKDVGGCQLVVRTKSGTRNLTDATFVVPPVSQWHAKYLGGFAGDMIFHGHLSPGHINASSVVFDCARGGKDMFYVYDWSWYDRYNYNHPDNEGGTFDEYRSYLRFYPYLSIRGGDLSWVPFAQAVASADGTTAEILVNGSLKIGSVNAVTGEYELDMSRFPAEDEMSNYAFRVKYSSRIGDEWPQTVYLSDTHEHEVPLQETQDNIPGDGYIREGRNNIEAFMDLNGNLSYDEGEPYGMVKGVEIGWHRLSPVTIELKDDSSVFPSTVVAAAGEAGAGQGGETSEEPISVVLRRRRINGLEFFANGSGSVKPVPVRMFLSKRVLPGDRGYLTEADVCSDDRCDLDFKWLVSDAVKIGMQPSDIVSAGYDLEREIDMGDGTVSNVLIKSFTKEFKAQRGKAMAVSPIQAAPVYTASPVIRFSAGDLTMTGYRLQIRAAGATTNLYDSGVKLLPGRVTEEAGQAVYEVGPSVFGDFDTGYADGSNYEWRVALYNAKFNADDEAAFNDWSTYMLDLRNRGRYPQIPTGSGSATACVRYYGAALTNDFAKLTIVEAFDTADFRGQPLARIRLCDATALRSLGDITTTNAVLRGIPEGRTYLRAFIDFNGNGVRDDWESWGYANYVDSDRRAIYNPNELIVASDTATGILSAKADRTIYIEDCDLNQNEIPDCLEDCYLIAEISDVPGQVVGLDSDGDGIADAAEEDYSTDPGAWDTDGDGMPDGWEAIFADLDPNYPDDADEALPDDVMAYAEVKRTFVTVWDGVNAASAVTYALAKGELEPRVGDPVDTLRFQRLYDYSKDRKGIGRAVPAAEYAGRLVTGVYVGDVVLVHNQVYREFGFNPRTATVQGLNVDSAYTKPFTSLDKYLVCRYLENEFGPERCKETDVNTRRLWAAYTLMPMDADCDRDGIADGWELYIGASPWSYADRDSDADGDGLRLLDEWDHLYSQIPLDPNNPDTDGDGIGDRVAFQYCLKDEDAGKDLDGDGLSNYAEYLLAEVFRLGAFDSRNAFSVDPNLPDCFFRVGQLYVGEIFTDHDRIDDNWERLYFDQVSPYIYDANFDPDEDGWSNYSEFQAGTDPTLLGSIGIDGVQMDEFPVPTVEFSFNYEGEQNIAGKPLVIKAWSDPTLQSIPDAVWTVSSGGSATTLDGNGTTNFINGVKYLGMNPKKEVMLHLSPGSIVSGRMQVEFKDLACQITDGSETYVIHPDTAAWQTFLVDRSYDDDPVHGEIIEQTTENKVGEINYVTGTVTIDFSKVSEFGTVAADITGAFGQGNWRSTYSLPSSYVRLVWHAKPITGGRSGTYYLASADARTEANNSLGHVKEGKNTFVAFYDLDGNGKYTAGEPYGTVNEVDVGWNYARVMIELTDTTPVIPRFDTQTGNCDRGLLYGTESGNLDPTKISEGTVAGGKYERVRIVRTAVAGYECEERGIPARVVLDKVVEIENESLYITEADIFRNGQLDLDWEYLADDLRQGNTAGLDISNVTYRVVLGNGSVLNSQTNNLLSLAFTRAFDSTDVFAAAKPVALGPGVVTTPQPTFSWTIPSGLNSYTAFNLVISDASGEVWRSGYTRLPARIKDPVYGWRYEYTAPIHAGEKLPNGKVFAGDESYTWKVTVANARFRAPYYENFSDPAGFLMNVSSATLDYGTVEVAVRYFGPDSVRNSGVIRVEAFETPDFSGVPVAVGYVASPADVATSATPITVANARILGLKSGSYYIRAFIDTDGNGLCDEWESWGFYCARDARNVAIYSPRSVKVGPNRGRSDVVPVYIDDSDTDQDYLPDAWEWATGSGLSAQGTEKLSLVANGGGILVNSALAQLSASGAVANGLRVLMSNVIGSPRVAAMICDVEVPAGADDEAIAAAIAADAHLKRVGSFSITGLEFNPEKKQVDISVKAEMVDGPENALYTFTGAESTLYRCQVWGKRTLAENWTLVGEQSVNLGVGDARLTVDMTDMKDAEASFYKVTIVR